MDNRLYINNQLVNLDTRQAISITVKTIDVSKLESRTVTHTNQFTVPSNEVNDVIFGFANNEKSRTSIPYVYQSCKFLQDGIEVIPNARLIVKSFSGGYRVNIFENIFNVFENVEGKLISEIDPIPVSGWLPSDMDAARNNTEGIVSALVYWGEAVGDIFDNDFFLPCFYYHTIITAILEDTGLNISGDILTDSRFTDLVVPFANQFLYPESVVMEFNGTAIDTGHSFGGVTSGSYYRIQLDEATSGDDNFDLANDQYEFIGDIPLTGTITANCIVSGVTFFSGTTLYFKLIRLQGVTETELDSVTIYPGDGNENVSYTGGIAVGDIFYIVLKSDAVGSPGVTGTIDEATFTMTMSRTVNPSSVSWKSLWPEIQCKDLLQDFFTRFGIIAKQKNGTIYLKTIEEILSDRTNAVDWSGKLVNSARPMDFSLKYAQNNTFDYTNTLNDEGIGRGIMTVANTTLPFQNAVFVSIFEQSEFYEYLLWRVASIPIFSTESVDNSDPSESPGVKLLTVKDRTDENGITFDSIARNDYKIAYFLDSLESKDTGFQYFLDEFYPTFTAALQKSKLIEKQYLLTIADVQLFDSHKMVYDGDGYYYVDEIRNFVPGDLTKVKLFKVA